MALFGGENKREKILILLTMCFALFMVMLDNTVVNVALPTMEKSLNTGVSGLQWIVDGYVLALASLLLTGGILGDRYGRKRMFLTGLAVFTLASLACGLAGSTEVLIIFRAMQGVGAALLLPGTLSILTVTFPPEERATAIGVWAGVSGIALALGPTLGGLVVEHIGWQSIFFLNVPIGIIGFFVAMRIVKESVSEQTRLLDLPGLGLGTASLFFITYALIEANQYGWGSVRIAGSLILGAILLATFLYWEHRSDHPMMPLSFFRIPAFSAGSYAAFSVSMGMFGMFFFMSLYMQNIRLYSPFKAGASFLPLTLMIVLWAPQAGRIAQKIGSRVPMTLGLLASGTSLLAFTQITATTPYWLVIAPLFVLMGLGLASVMTPMTAAVMGSVGPQRAGLGAGMTNTAREIGGAFGIALLGTLLTTRIRSELSTGLQSLHLTPTQIDAIKATAGHGQQLSKTELTGLSGQQLGGLYHALSNAFLSGFHLALLVASIVLFIASVVAWRFIPAGAPRHDGPHPGGDKPTAEATTEAEAAAESEAAAV